MGEYIIYWDGIGATLSDMLRDRVPLALWAKRIRRERLREPIVRCRDCRQYDAEHNDCAEFGDVWHDEWAPVEPDGFCAWAVKRKEVGE